MSESPCSPGGSRKGSVQRITMVLVLALLVGSSGCVHHRVVAQSGDPVRVMKQTATHHQYLWGLVGEPSIFVDDCVSHSLYDVEVSTTVWQALATFFTLWIWAPVTVEWRCATVPTVNGNAPVPCETGEVSDATDR